MAFLGGKYLQPEQVITGNVQTFRAREAATGRSVFVHRIAETAQPEQAALLKLLLSCLYRSSAVKELVLDVREEGDLCFVVTESVPQCLLLREWLQFESDRSDPGTKPAGGQASAPRAPAPIAPQRPAPPPAVSRPSPLAQAGAGPGEFTRMFQAMDPSKVETLSKAPPPAQGPVRPVTPAPPQFGNPQRRPESPEKPQSSMPAGSAPPSPGEFTRLFQSPPGPVPQTSNDLTGSPAAAVEPPPPARPRPAESHSTPGEFTRFFGGSSPARNPEGFSLPVVQRPISPQNVAPPPQAPGEFTQLFSGQVSRPVPLSEAMPQTPAPSTSVGSFHPTAAAPSGTAGEFTRIFGGGTERPSSPGVSKSVGEYTQLFGTNDPAPALPSAQPPAFAAGSLNEPGPSIQQPKPAPQGPSEFTRVVMGSGAVSAEPVPAKPASPPTVPPLAGGIPGVHASAIPSAPSIPAAPHPAVPAAPVPAPQISNKPNRALLLLFLILFILAVALVIVIAVAAKR